MGKEEELQKKYMQFQLMASQAQEMREQINVLESKLTELRMLISTLESLPKLNKNASTWSNLGMSTYVNSKLSDTKEVLVNVGAGVFMKKNIPTAIETVKSQISMSETYLEQLVSSLQTISMQAEALQSELA